jgi:hypothetical protein
MVEKFPRVDVGSPSSFCFIVRSTRLVLENDAGE